MNVAASPEALSLWHLISQASLLVQLVLVVLLFASVMAWTMIFQKWSVIRGAQTGANDFEDRFWSGGDLAQLYTEWAPRRSGGINGIFVAGFREFTRLSKAANMSRDHMVEGVQRAMRVALNREVDELEHHLPFLATVGSTSPYVGLFGTVWGIMNSFRALGAMQQTTIASVAPGIAEALIATAMGLFAAIPAVIAYNRYSTQVERLVSRYESFMEEFLSIVSRQSGA